ncbi:MAG TPA: YceI family protein [Streptosporangiaceae bacterium]|nr:YceI family protein [Streptosporangiaceae bacterium]
MTTPAQIPGYQAGTWIIEPVNSDVSFTVRYLGVTRVHGRFNEIAGEIVTGPTVAGSSVRASIAAASIDTGFPGRDNYLRGGDVLRADEHKELSFVSTGIRAAAGELAIDGGLTIRGVTRPVSLALQPGGFAADPAEGGHVLGLSATTTITRAEFGFSQKLPAAVISDSITVQLDIQARLAA